MFYLVLGITSLCVAVFVALVILVVRMQQRVSDYVDHEIIENRYDASPLRKCWRRYFGDHRWSVRYLIPLNSLLRGLCDQLAGFASEFSNHVVQEDAIGYAEYGHSRIWTLISQGLIDRWRVSFKPGALWHNEYFLNRIARSEERPVEVNIRAKPERVPNYTVVRIVHNTLSSRRVWKLLVVTEWYAVCMARAEAERAECDTHTFAKIIAQVGSVCVPYAVHADLVASTSLAAHLSRCAYIWRQKRMGVSMLRD
jgi:hypothetical protein